MKIEQYNRKTAALFEREPSSRILNALKEGSGNGIHGPDLAKRAGLSVRDMQKLIETIRRRGVCICADRNGYYFPDSESCVRKYITQEEQRGKSIFASLKAATNLLKTLTKE